MKILAKRLKRWTYLVHRWIGVASCLLFVMWFLSGLVMMYVPFPNLPETVRRSGLAALDMNAVAMEPDAILVRAGLSHFPQQFRLEMLDQEPVYRIVDGTSRIALSARDGRPIVEADSATAERVATRYAPAQKLVRLGDVDRDQWTVTARYDPLRPFYLFAAGGGDATHIYVSRRTGATALVTTRYQRFWNWLGAIPHWIYPTVLRRDGALWRSVVLWISGVAMISAFSGIYIGLHRLHLRHRFRGNRVSPYRGVAAWHHWTGLFGGVALATWIFSGWLSLDPGHIFRGPGISAAARTHYAGHMAPDTGFDLARLRQIATTRQAAPTDIAFTWVGGEALATFADAAGSFTVGPDGLPAPSIGTLRTAIQQLQPDADLTLVRIEREDAYWYRHHRDRILPVLRAEFADARQTWIHIDPKSGDILGSIDAKGRQYRWLYNGLHSLDFGFLLRHRPAWDIVVGILLALGTIVSASGTIMGWRRLRR